MEITVPTQDNPTPAERRGWVGAAVGRLAVIPLLMVATGPVGASVISALGLVGGYLLGKHGGVEQEQQEIAQGYRRVKEPTFWNHEMAKGYATGAAVSLGIGLLTGTLLAGSALVPWLAAAAALTVVGMTIAGSLNGKRKMQQEYAEEEHIRVVQVARSLSPERHPVPQIELSSQSLYALDPADVCRFAIAEEKRRKLAAVNTNAPGHNRG